MENSFFIAQTHSTNDLLKALMRERTLPEGFVVRAAFQTAGKGQAGNSWESANGENLLFSLLLYPVRIKVEQQFVISQLVSVAIKQTLDKYVDDITVKWPNDIYWKDKKLGGILIENSLQNSGIKSTIIGIGINVNQQVFLSCAPNPVSLSQITGKQYDEEMLMDEIRWNIQGLYARLNPVAIRMEYGELLYRKSGFHCYKTDEETFHAEIVAVHPNGQLELETESGERRCFYFKEVQFVI